MLRQATYGWPGLMVLHHLCPLQSEHDGEELPGINVRLLLDLLYPLRLACAGGKLLLRELGPDFLEAGPSQRPIILEQLCGEPAYW